MKEILDSFHKRSQLFRTPLIAAYTCEIWPFSLRSRGLVVVWISAYLALFFNIFVNAIALEQIGWKYYFVFIAVLIWMFITVFFFYPETKNRTLESMAALFDGEDAVPNASDVQEKVEVLRRESIGNGTKEHHDIVMSEKA